MPAASKFDGSSQASNARRAAGHSPSRSEYQAVSRLRPLTIMCWRKTPSKVNPEPEGGAARALVRRVALPLQAPVAERVERVPGQQPDRLRGLRRALERGAEPDVPDLHAPVRRLGPQEADHAAGAARGAVDDREEQRVVGRRPLRDPVGHLLGVANGP